MTALWRPALRRPAVWRLATRSLSSSPASPLAAAEAAVPRPWQNSPNVDASQCHDPLVREDDLQVLEDVMTEQEELVVTDEAMKLLKRRRYEENHWDNVIVNFKEMERSRWSSGRSPSTLLLD